MCEYRCIGGIDYLAALFFGIGEKSGIRLELLLAAHVCLCVGELRVSFFRCKSVKINLLKNDITHLGIVFCSMGKIIAICCSLEVCVGVLVKSYCFNIEQASCSCRRELPTESIVLRFLCFQ